MSDSTLPSSWCAVKLGEIVEYGVTEKAEPADIPPDSWILELEDIEKDTSKLLQRVRFSDRNSKSTKNAFAAGDVLYGKLRPYLNKVLIADIAGYCSTEILPLKASPFVNGRFLFYSLKHPGFLDYVTAASHGMNMPRLGTSAGLDAPAVLAPVNEQNRIANKLEILLKRVESCREKLDRVPLILKRFRQSVLAAATSGALTEDWRGEHLHDGWIETSIGEVCTVVRGASPRPAGHPRFFGGTIPWITVGELTKDKKKCLKSVASFVTEEGKTRSRFIEAGTLLLTNSGATLGVPKITLIGGCINDGSVALLGAKEPLKSYLYYVLTTMTDALRNINQGAAQPNLNTGIVRDINFKMPKSAEEQAEIVRRIEKLFGFADSLEVRYTTLRNQLDKLTPSLLAKAFRGELVEQDPNDEPASVLLERIKAERAAQAETKLARGRNTKTAG